jgi:hypothetical protein
MDVTRGLSSAHQPGCSQKHFCIHVRSSIILTIVRQRTEEHIEEKVKRKGVVDVRDFISVGGTVSLFEW